MNLDTIKKLTDAELQQAITWALEEQKARAHRHKQETIAKIKALAAQVGVSIAIEGTRGRPSRKGNRTPAT